MNENLVCQVNEHSHPVSFHVQASRPKRAKPQNPRKKQKCQKSGARGNLKTDPSRKKITNARVLLRANDVRGVHMNSVTFAPLTSEVDD
jgi:hypothetical protein